MSTSIRLTRGLEPEVCINNFEVSSVVSGALTYTSVTNIALVGAVLSHMGLAISASIDNEVASVACIPLDVVEQLFHIV